MDLPALLPEELSFAALAKDDQKLLELLLKLPPHFILFFQYAADDETWTEGHLDFMREAVRHLSKEAFEDRLLYRFVHAAVLAIRRHPRTLASLLPKNLKAKLGTSEYPIASLLWQGASSKLHLMIRDECKERKRDLFDLGKLPLFVFEDIEEFLETGGVKNLWRREPDAVLKVIDAAHTFELFELETVAEEIMQRYIERANAVSLLLLASDKGWRGLKKHCEEFLNALDDGVAFMHLPPGQISFEFLNFLDPAFRLFEDLKKEITHLVFGGVLNEAAEFSRVLKETPKLIGVSLSRSRAYSDRLEDLPERLLELDLSKCAWLNERTFGKVLQICPALSTLILQNNTQLDFRAFSEIRKLKNLMSLDLSRCHQLSDDDLKIILQGKPPLRKLILTGCSKLSEHGFGMLGRFLPRLDVLDAAKTQITDEALIEVASKASQLFSLNLDRCENLTERGVIEAVRLLPRLEKIFLERVMMPSEGLLELERIKPALEVVR